jgi:hypothetical protein
MLVEVDSERVLLKLHGNVIASESVKTGAIVIFDAGWQTNTTKERLNGLLAMLPSSKYKYITQKQWRWYIVDVDGVEHRFNVGLVINI